MPRQRRTAAQKDAVASFVQRLYEQSETESWAAFARKAKVHWASLSDWQTGKSVLDGWNLLQLIGAVSPAGLTAALDATADARATAAPRVLRAELEESVGELLDWQTTAIEQLSDLDKRLAQLETAPASQRKTRRGQVTN